MTWTIQWLFDFQAWCCREWNMVQDVWWWNSSMLPTAHSQERHGLLRGSVKGCVWVGGADCYRSQGAVLWSPSADMIDKMESRASNKGREVLPSGFSIDKAAVVATVLRRGGTTPFNLLPIPNADSSGAGGFEGHGAGSPFALCDWWVRYICPPAGVVLDMFSGGGTVGVAAVLRGCSYIGVEREAEYIAIARARLTAADRQGRLDL